MNKKIRSVIEGSEKYRIVDLLTGDESFTDSESEAYQYAGLFMSRGHSVLIEARGAHGIIVWKSEASRLAA